MADSISKTNFILQQGFAEPEIQSCNLQFTSLLFQPRIIGIIVLTGAIFQSYQVFISLCLVLYWCAAAPELNPLKHYIILFTEKETQFY